MVMVDMCALGIGGCVETQLLLTNTALLQPSGIEIYTDNETKSTFKCKGIWTYLY